MTTISQVTEYQTKTFCTTKETLNSLMITFNMRIYVDNKSIKGLIS